MKIIILMISIFGTYCPIFAQPPNENYDFWRPVLENKYPITIKNIHDGDTFTVDISISNFNIILNDQTLRASTYDACEVSRIRRTTIISNEEIKRGIEARDYIKILNQQYQFYITTTGKRDVYGRLLTEIFLTDSQHQNQFLDLKILLEKKHYLR